MVDPEKIRMLVEMMAEHELSEICLRDGEEEIRLKRAGAGTAPGEGSGDSPAQMVVSPQMVVPHQRSAATSTSSEGQADRPTPEDDGLATIKSPMVGTFYSAPDPDSPAFVSVGDRVTADTVVCIVEAMKVFNEIKAEIAGTIEETLVDNEDPVEFGQPLFLVVPD